MGEIFQRICLCFITNCVTFFKYDDIFSGIREGMYVMFTMRLTHTFSLSKMIPTSAGGLPPAGRAGMVVSLPPKSDAVPVGSQNPASKYFLKIRKLPIFVKKHILVKCSVNSKTEKYEIDFIENTCMTLPLPVFIGFMFCRISFTEAWLVKDNGKR